MSGAVLPKIYTIPLGMPFVDCLAQGLWQLSGENLERLSAMTVLLPSRRAVKALQEAFLRLPDRGRDVQAMILPRLRPVGDIDEMGLLESGLIEEGEAEQNEIGEIPPALSSLRRTMILARHILARGEIGGERPRLDQAIPLAEALGSFLDEVETEGLSLDNLDRLVPDDLAKHWQITLDFFDLLRRHWPMILEEEEAIDPAARRNRVLDIQARAWLAHPPAHPVIAAGITGSIPAVARLMAVVASLPQGRIVLPGLDQTLNDDDWQAVENDPTHPQYGMARLLRHLEKTRIEVASWLDIAGDLPSWRKRGSSDRRQALISKSLLPGERTDRWPTLLQEESYSESDWAGLERIDCRNEQEEALVIALSLRQFLEEESQGIAALVTPDRGLAQRVVGELRRWSIEIEDSAGKPLSAYRSGIYFLALAEAAAQQWRPIPLLSFLKHPLCNIALPTGDFRRWLSLFERRVLRGLSPALGWQGILSALDRQKERVKPDEFEFIRTGILALQHITEPLADWNRDISPATRLASLIAVAEALAATEIGNGPARLYADEDGEALAKFLNEALDVFAGIPPCDGTTFEGILQKLFAQIDVRPPYGPHPRLFIWGVLEARLQQTDLLILGGLNEGTWPQIAKGDIWMSEQMRRQFGLPSLEQGIGLSAHDFQQALGVKRVVMTRAERVGGQPASPSRWLLRLDALRACLNMETLAKRAPLQDWAIAIDAAGASIPCERPKPSPGGKYRPESLSISKIEIWRRDPYALYAAAVLKLKKLEPLHQEPRDADLGSIIHAALDSYLLAHGDSDPLDPRQALLDIGRTKFGDLLNRPEVWAFWWPRFQEIAEWFVKAQADRRVSIARSYTEVKAEAQFTSGRRAFTLLARADRLDIMKDGTLTIIDYKTGGIPGGVEIALGYAPQLALESMLVEMGAFDVIPEITSVGEIVYWHLSGKDSKISDPKIDRRKLDPTILAREAESGLRCLLDHYSTDGASYIAVPDKRYQLRYNDYEHLERILEWSSGDSSE